MKHATPDLFKFKRLQRKLNESKRGIVGLLELLWIETQKNCPAGDIGRYTNEEIAIMCDWIGDPDQLVSALVTTGWIDESTDHRLVIHDWAQHCPNYLRAAFVSHGKSFASSMPSKVLSNLPEQPALATCSSTVLSRGQPNLTEPNHTKPVGPGPGCAEPEPEPDEMEIDLADPLLAEASTRIIEPVQSERLHRSVFSPLQEVHLQSVANLCEWHSKQLSAAHPVAGNTEAHLLLVIAAAIHAMSMPATKVETSRVAVFIGIVKKRSWKRVARHLPKARQRLDDFRRTLEPVS